MKALSIRQPWAWAILQAGKRIENREWRAAPTYRGPLLIHAAKGCTGLEYQDAAGWMVDAGVAEQCGAWDFEVERAQAESRIVVPRLADLDRGGVVGVCRLADVVAVDRMGHQRSTTHILPTGDRCHQCDAAGEALQRACPKRDRWFFGPLGLVLADVRALPFVPFPGALGFFDVPDTLVPGARQ